MAKATVDLDESVALQLKRLAQFAAAASYRTRLRAALRAGKWK